MKSKRILSLILALAMLVLCTACSATSAEAAGAPFGETITEAVFYVRPDDGYVRLDIVDEHGRHADTRAFDVAELL